MGSKSLERYTSLSLKNGEDKENRDLANLKLIDKTEIRQHLEEYNVFALAHVLGYFIQSADSLIYYMFAKKLLFMKDEKDLPRESLKEEREDEQSRIEDKKGSR